MEGITGVCETRNVEEGPRISFSERFWGIQWSQLLPLSFEDARLTVQRTDAKEGMEFLDRFYSEIFGAEPSLQPFFEGSSPHYSSTRRRYYDEFGDFFKFCAPDRGHQMVGLFIGTPVDWSTYYLRYLALLPGFTGFDVGYRLLEWINLQLAQSGHIGRIETEASPLNGWSVPTFTRLGFHITGTNLTDRWGAALRFTKFVDPQAKQIFRNQFCQVLNRKK